MKGWGLVGPTYQLRSMNAALERSINLYPRRIERGGKADFTLDHTPGVRPFARCSRAGWFRGGIFCQGRLFVVISNVLYEISSRGVVTTRGNVRQDRNPATLDTNGDGGFQVFIVSGGNGYIFDLNTDTLTEIVDADFPSGHAIQGAFMDGYFIVLTDQNTFYLSALEDGLTWDALDVNQRSVASDPWRAMLVTKEEVYLLGEKTSDVYYNSGDADTPFLPIQNSRMDVGIYARASLCRLDNTVLWVQGDERGSGMVVRAQGFTPQRVSNHAVEYFLQQSRQLADAYAWSYQMDGSLFYVLTVPDLETTWVYDVSVNQWHERALWHPRLAKWEPHIARGHVYAWGKHLVGDRQSGTVYELSLDQLYDHAVLTT